MGYYVIGQETRSKAGHVLEAMFRTRYEIFIRGKEPDDYRIDSPLGYEVDNFDNGTAEWHNVIDENLVFYTGGRMTSWKYPTATWAKFEQHVKYGDLPYNREDYVDWTRAYRNNYARKGKYEPRLAALMFWYGFFRHCEEVGIKGYTGVISRVMFQMQSHMPVDTKVLSDWFSEKHGDHVIIRANLRSDTIPRLMEMAHAQGYDIENNKVYRNLECLPSVERRFSPEIVFALTKAYHMGLRSASEIKNLYNRYTGENIEHAEAVMPEIQDIMMQVAEQSIASDIVNNRNQIPEGTTIN